MTRSYLIPKRKQVTFFAATEVRFKYKVLRPTSIPSFPRLSATAALALAAFACGELPTEPPAPAPPGSFTALHVEGNRIVDADGADRILRGVAVVDPLAGRASRYRPNPSEREIETLAVEWNAGIVRVPMHPDLMSHNPGYLRAHVDPLVEWAGERELYLLLGYHAHGNPLTGEVEDTPWGSNPPWNGNPYNPDLGLALAFNAEIAARYRDRPWVLYSVFNEPAYISWSEWRPVAEQLVDAVRDQHPEALILVSGVDFASELDGVLSDPVRRDGIVYEIHPYPWVGESWKKVVSELAATFPVFLGEWGFGAGHPASMRRYGNPWSATARSWGSAGRPGSGTTPGPRACSPPGDAPGSHRSEPW